MSPHITELMPAAALTEAIDVGLVRAQLHPDGHYQILNYTEKATYTRAWDEVTTQCRGLIIDDAGRVVARPWPKFFNHGEHPEGDLDLTAPVEVTDKEDGSLGVLWHDRVRVPHIATRGSLTSPQALHATDLYRSRYAQTWLPRPDTTYLFEIIYPANRIVRDYGPMDDLILLGAVDIETGWVYGPHDPPCTSWRGPRTKVFQHATLAEALAAPPRPGAEGLVVRYLTGPNPGTLVKIKQDDYVALHRIITGLTARRLWEHLAVNAAAAETGHPARHLAQRLKMDPADVQGILDAGPGWRDDLLASIPEEFQGWVHATTDALHDAVRDVRDQVAATITATTGLDRRDVAAHVAGHPHRGLVFAALDGKPWAAAAWAAVRPAAERPVTLTEDTA